MVYPMTFGLTSTQLTRVLEAAGRAPSLHNSQPWCFRLTNDRIELHVDSDRLLPATDPDGRETRLACGAALFNLRLALDRYGVRAAVTLQPDGPSGALALIESGGETRLSPERADMERAIPYRRTHRRPFFDADVPLNHRQTLVRAAQRENGILHLITDPAQLTKLRAWAGEAQRSQTSNPGWAAEWSKWTGRQNTTDGVPLTAAGPPPAPQDQWTLRDFGPPNRPERLPGKDFEDQPLIAVLATWTDRPRSQVQAGQALERVLLTATDLGLSISFLSQLIEVATVKERLRDLLGGRTFPQAVLRIGFGGPVPATPRRPVEDTVLVEAPVLSAPDPFPIP